MKKDAMFVIENNINRRKESIDYNKELIEKKMKTLQDTFERDDYSYIKVILEELTGIVNENKRFISEIYMWNSAKKIVDNNIED